jgi:hypothetical protein
MGRIYDFKRGGGTLVFVSHDPGTVEHVCDRAILIDGGAVVFDGDPSEIISRYHRLLADEASGLGARVDGVEDYQEAPETTYDPDAVLSTDIVNLVAARLVRDGSPTGNAICGADIMIEVDLESSTAAADAVVGISLATETGTALYGISTRHCWAADEEAGQDAIRRALSRPGTPVTVRLTVPALPLQSGSVDVYVAVNSADEATQYMGGRRVLSFGVFSEEPSLGLVAMNAHWEVVPQRGSAAPRPG